jgi:hypothetical protein
MGVDAEFIVWAPDPGPSVFFSRFSPYSWTASTGIPPQSQVRSDRVNKQKFYGFKAGRFYVSLDGGASFSASAATPLPAGSARFRPVPGIEGDIWLAGGSRDAGDVYGLWHSIDSGASFARIAAVDEADVVGFGKSAPGMSYPAIYLNAKIAGVRGIFRSDDAGASFTRVNDDRHQYGAASSVITGDRNIYGRVYLGTNGRGIIVGSLGI